MVSLGGSMSTVHGNSERGELVRYSRIAKPLGGVEFTTFSRIRWTAGAGHRILEYLRREGYPTEEGQGTPTHPTLFRRGGSCQSVWHGAPSAGINGKKRAKSYGECNLARFLHRLGRCGREGPCPTSGPRPPVPGLPTPRIPSRSAKSQGKVWHGNCRKP